MDVIAAGQVDKNMSGKTPENKVACPSCGHEFNVNDALHHQLENQLRTEFSEQKKQQQQAIDAEKAALAAQQAQLDDARKHQEQ